MARLPQWEISFRKTQDGTDPFGDFASSLPTPARIEWEAIIRLLQKRGKTLKGNRVLLHTHDRFEYRGDEVRVFYEFISPTEIRIVAGFRTADSAQLVDPK